MGKLVVIFGDMGFTKIGKDSNHGLRHNNTFILFPANQFNLIKSIFKDEDNSNVSYGKNFSCYLSYAKWSSPTCREIKCSYERNAHIPHFSDNELFEKLSLKFTQRELELHKELVNAFNSNPGLLEQKWEKQNISFAEFAEILNVAKLNDPKFEVKLTKLNQSDDMSVDFFHGAKSKVGKFLAKLDNFVNLKDVKPKFSFRLSDLILISTNDGQVFNIQTRVGDYAFPYLYKLHGNLETHEHNW